MQVLEDLLKGSMATQVCKTFQMGPECNIRFTHEQHSFFLEAIKSRDIVYSGILTANFSNYFCLRLNEMVFVCLKTNSGAGHFW